MSRIINVKVSQQPKQVQTKFGRKTVCNFLNQQPHTPESQREIVVWRPANDAELMSLTVGQQVKLLHDGKKYFVVHEPNSPNNFNNPNNGNGRVKLRHDGGVLNTEGGHIPAHSRLS